MTKPAPVIVGAVLYDPNVPTIWQIIRDFFDHHECPIDVEFFQDSESQVEALLAGRIDIAWNSPLAWLEAQRQSAGRCQAIAMRDTDRDRVSHLVVRGDGGITHIADLRGKTVAVGAKDSPQATLIPLGLLEQHGLEPGRDFRVERFDVLVGKHGDHVGGELDAYRALEHGLADACAMLDLNWKTWTQNGTIAPDRYRILASTDQFDHCVFTARERFPPERQLRWLDVLISMNHDNPKHRETMGLEGLKQWLPGRTTGFGPLTEAVERQHFFDGSEV